MNDITRMIDELESSTFGATATEKLLPPTWSKWYELSESEISNWSDLSGIGEGN